MAQMHIYTLPCECVVKVLSDRVILYERRRWSKERNACRKNHDDVRDMARLSAESRE